MSSSLKDAKVSEMGGLDDGYWVWGCFGFLEQVGYGFVGSLSLVLQVLVNEVPSWGTSDMVIWKPEPEEGYLVKSGTSVLEKVRVTNDVDVALHKAFCSLWLTNSPFKVQTFIWRCLINRISMKDQLVHRGILHFPHDLLCVICFQDEEELSHLFFNYRVAKVIWEKVVQWVGFEWVNEEFIWKSFLSSSGAEKFKVLKKGNSWIV